MVFQIDDATLSRVTNGRRRIAARAMRDTINDLLSNLETYGGLTGKFTHIPPARRVLDVMLAELETTIDALS